MRRIKLFTLLAAWMLSVGTMFADDSVASGTCGDNLTWELTADGALIISGTGAMTDFSYPSYGPWNANRGAVKSISLPEGLTTIGQYAFYMMDKMNTAVVIPEGVTSIGYAAFAGQRELPAVTLPSTLITIAGSVFSTANKLTSLTIPANVNSIGTMLTEECNALTSIVVDANNRTFDSRDNCNAIIKTSTNALVAGCQTTVIPNTVVSIGVGAFSTLKSLTSIKIPNSVTTLGNYCFQYCTNVEALVLPTSVVNISGSAFTGCVFKTIEVIPGNPKFDSRDNCNAIIETATNTLVKGSENSVLPDELLTLGEGAFMSNKNLKFINIPASVERLQKNALIYCSGLKAITCYATTPPAADNLAFNYGSPSIISIPPTIPVYVPAASIDAYRSAANWNYFTNFVPLSGGDTVYYTIKALANHGKVNGTGTYASGTEITLTPVAEEGYVFKQWSDGTTASPKSLTLTCDTTIRAMFEKVGESAPEPVVDKDEPNVITFKFQAILKAFLYNVVIMKNGERVVDILLDSEGHIKLVTEAASAPSHMKVRKVKSDDGSLLVALTALEVGQQYTYMVDAYDAQETCISAKAGSFSVSRGIIMGDQSTAEEITNILTTNNGLQVADLSITRTIQRNDYFSTLCVPFGMNATQIANSSLATAEIREFTKAQVVDNQLYVVCSPVSEIVAGKPYVIRYTDASALNRLDFSNVTVNAAAPDEVTHDHVTMKGTYIPFEATSGNCFVFVNDDNMPYWPSTPSTLKPFRCYFIVDTNGNDAPVCGMPVNIVEREKAPTALETVRNDLPFVKTIENGMLIIEKNGVRYNAQGQIVK